MACSHKIEPTIVEQKGEHLVVDIHAHLNVAAADTKIRENIPNLPSVLPFSCPATDEANKKMFQRVGGKLNGTNERLQEMDQLGVDVQVLSPNPGQYYYFAEDELGLSVCQIINNQIAEAIANQPRRFVGLATLPLQNVQLAIEEMRRCVRECGMRGVEVGTYVAGKELAHDDFRPFFKEAEKLDVMIFIHPLGFSHGERLSLHHLNNIVGNPIESTIALSHLIFSGVLDSYPGLKICVAHGGGYLPGYWGRMDHAFHAREDCRLHISNKPSSYLRKIWFDSVVFDKQQLQSMIETHGADKICLGTDYPFDMAEPDPVGFLSELPMPLRRKISGLNAAELLGLKSEKMF